MNALPFLYKRINCFIFFGGLFFYSNFASAQIGIKIAQSKPMGTFGADFSKAPTFEFIFHTKVYDGKVLSRISLTYTNFKPREDTIPTYTVKFQNGYTMYPTKLSYLQLPYFGLSIDNQLKIFEIKKFEFFAGLGLSFMKANYEYNRGYGLLSRKDYVVGGNISALGMYNLNSHFAIFGDLQYQYGTFTDWSYKFHNRKIGFGLLYTFNPDDED